jgi:4-amino-4-deoxy-L-arabinose transferase-like glycosyltransferase
MKMDKDRKYKALLLAILGGMIVNCVLWRRADCGIPIHDEYIHYFNALQYLDMIREGRWLSYLFPDNNMYYPVLIHQLTAWVLLLAGRSLTAAVLGQAPFWGILVFSTYGVGKKLWNEDVGFLAAVAAVSFPFATLLSQKFYLDGPLAAMIALSAYFLLRSDFFRSFPDTVGFFVALGLALTIKSTALFYVFFPLLCYTVIFVSRVIRRGEGKKELAAGLAGLAILMAGEYVFALSRVPGLHRMTRDYLNAYPAFYLKSVLPIAAVLAAVLLIRFRDLSVKAYLAGALSGILVSWHFYLFRFMALPGEHAEIVSRGYFSLYEYGLVPLGLYLKILSLCFLGIPWTLFLLSGIGWLFAGERLTPEKAIFLAAPILPLVYFHFFPYKDPRFYVPLIVFLAPLITFWIPRVSPRPARLAAYGLFFLAALLGTWGWAVPSLRSPVQFQFEIWKDLELLSRRPRVMAPARLETLKKITDAIYTAMDGKGSYVIFTGERSMDTDREFHWFFLEKTGIPMHDDLVERLPSSLDFSYNASESNTFLTCTVKGEKWAGRTGGITAINGSPGGEVYAAGESGVISQRIGNNWRNISVSTGKELMGLWISPRGNIYAVGDEGLILRKKGNRQVLMQSGTKSSLEAVFGFSDNDILASGEGGTLLRFDGREWKHQDSGTKKELLGIWGSGPNDVYAVGGEGQIIHWNGKSWQTVFQDAGVSLTRIWGVPGGPVFAVGAGGVILKKDGDGWARMESPTSLDLQGLFGRSPNEFYAAGKKGTLLRFDGTGWKKIETGREFDFNDVWQTPGGEVLAGGDDPSIHLLSGSRLTPLFMDNVEPLSAVVVNIYRDSSHREPPRAIMERISKFYLFNKTRVIADVPLDDRRVSVLRLLLEGE